jgi:hypothetical protein
LQESTSIVQIRLICFQQKFFDYMNEKMINQIQFNHKDNCIGRYDFIKKLGNEIISPMSIFFKEKIRLLIK